VGELDLIETAMLRGAAQALRQRADRQAKLAEAGTTRADHGVVIRTGEAAIATRIAMTLAALADEIDGAAR